MLRTYLGCTSLMVFAFACSSGTSSSDTSSTAGQAGVVAGGRNAGEVPASGQAGAMPGGGAGGWSGANGAGVGAGEAGGSIAGEGISAGQGSIGGGDPNMASGGHGGVTGANGGYGGVMTGASGGSAGAAAQSKCAFTAAEYFLWTGDAPGASAAKSKLVELFTERSTTTGVRDRSVSGVSKPSLFPYLPKHPNGAAAIVFPGGSYTHLAFDVEGVDIATWLNSIGVTAFILKYRLPSDFTGSPWIPLADAQRAVRTVRSQAAACGIDGARLGIVGFSAGGHDASQLETRGNAPSHAVASTLDVIDAIDARPSFAVLMYPVISMGPTLAHSGSKSALLGASPSAADVALYSSELQVTSSTPATFVGVSSKDTSVDPKNSERFDDALKAANVPEEFHLYNDGKHGVGIRNATGDMAAWPSQCKSWLSARHVIPPAE